MAPLRTLTVTIWRCALIRIVFLVAPLCSMNSYPEKPHPIDWSYYRSSASASGIVDSFQKQYEAVTVPYPKDTASASIEKREREVVC